MFVDTGMVVRRLKQGINRFLGLYSSPCSLPCISMNTNNDLLRSRYLGFWLTVSQRKLQAGITFPHSTEPLKGQLIAIDSQSNRIRVDNLNTPTGNLPHTALRITDIDTIEFPMLSST